MTSLSREAREFVGDLFGPVTDDPQEATALRALLLVIALGLLMVGWGLLDLFTTGPTITGTAATIIGGLSVRWGALTPA